MKIMATLSLVLLSACASTSAARAASAPDVLAGHWRGSFGSGPGVTPFELQFDRSAGGYLAHYWSAIPAGTSLPVTNVESGHLVRFTVPRIGVFEGELRERNAGDGLLEGTYSGDSGNGSFILEKQPDPTGSWYASLPISAQP